MFGELDEAVLPTALATIPSSVMNVLYHQTKKMMGRMVDYKELIQKRIGLRPLLERATARYSRDVCHRQRADAPRSSSACGRVLLGNPLDGKPGVHLWKSHAPGLALHHAP